MALIMKDESFKTYHPEDEVIVKGESYKLKAEFTLR